MEFKRLRVGDSGDEVALLHERLNVHGVDVSPEEKKRNFFGPSTREALSEFQKIHGIDPSCELCGRTATLLAGEPLAAKSATDSKLSPSALTTDLNISGQPAAKPTIETSTPPFEAPKVRAASDSLSKVSSIQTRLKTLKTVLTDLQHENVVSITLSEANGDWQKAHASLKDKGEIPTDTLRKLDLAHSLADLSSDHIPVVKALVDDPSIKSLRDVALRFNVEKLTGLVDAASLPEDVAGATIEEKKKSLAIRLQHGLFNAEPTAVLHRMVKEAEIPIADSNVRTGVTNFLNNQPEFNIRTASIYAALKHPEAFKNIAEEHRPEVIKNLKIIQRVQAISPIPEAVPVLIKANLNSAFRVAEMPESTFIAAYGPTLSDETARLVYTNAINVHIRNEQALMTIRESMHGTGLGIIDGQMTAEERIAASQGVIDQNAVPLNLETLFGGIDYCECDDCLSVYSPASYFVDLLQYLRNNNLDPAKIKTDPKDITNTPLDMLFRRRPDLGCLELTCENTNTILPNIDLVNEIMESFIVHLEEYSIDPNVPKKSILEAFNVNDETTSELLAQPQHINYRAYCILKSAVYPFTLPYHQPIDSIRIWLKYMGTSRYELMDTFRTEKEICAKRVLIGDRDQKKQLKALHAMILDRAADAEFLGLTQEEYIILTRQAFWPKDYFDLTLQKVHTDEEYRKEIGVLPVHEYYGYKLEDEMLSLSETRETGLTFVKDYFLPRTGIQYTDLVELLKTQFINPNLPQGKALTILESIRFSYRFLQTLVDSSSNDQKVRFAKLIEFLNTAQPLVPLVDVMLHPDPCNQLNWHDFLKKTDFSNWIYCYFERIGKIIVLESGEGPKLPIEGQLFYGNDPIGILRKDGIVLNNDGVIIGNVSITGQVLSLDGKPLVENICSLKKDRTVLYKEEVVGSKVIGNIKTPGRFVDVVGGPLIENFICTDIFIKDGIGNIIGFINAEGIIGYFNKEDVSGGIYDSYLKKLNWLPSRNTCDLDKARLTHLDGSPLTVDEYDRMQCFIRLWRKLGWTIEETDQPIGLSATTDSSTIKSSENKVVGFVVARNDSSSSSNPSSITVASSECKVVGFDAFQDNCIEENAVHDEDSPEEDGSSNCPDMLQVPKEISPEFLHQLVAIQKLKDLTGLPLDKLLTFWSPISTCGKKSLYARLFLNHNILGIDKIFEPDTNGNYLVKQAKISEHSPVLMAALKLKADEVMQVMAFRQLQDELTLSNVSALYRHKLLAKILHVQFKDLSWIVQIFGDPFKSAEDALKLFLDWGKMEDAGFAFIQLDYLINGHDDPLRPQSPAKRTVLQITKTLYDGLNAIESAHKDVPPDKKHEATADLIRSEAGLLYEQSTVEKILGLLDGTTVYTTNAPPDLAISISDIDTLSKKLKYINNKNTNPHSASIQVVGILTDGEKKQAIDLSKESGWAKAFKRIDNKALQSFKDVISSIIPRDKQVEAKTKLLAGDVNLPFDPNNPNAINANTSPDKRFYFLQYFLPFLRQQLSHRLIIETLSGAAQIADNVTDILLSDILLIGASKEPAINVLEQIHLNSTSSNNDWKGYMIPPADGMYLFFAPSLVDDKQPPDIMIDGQPTSFTVQQEDPSNIWSTDPENLVPLKGGKLYKLEVVGRPATELQWKTSASSKANIPASALLPDYSINGIEEVFIKLYKAALLVNGFKLNVDEVSYWQNHPDDFDGFDFNEFDSSNVTSDIKLKHWSRIQSYTSFRDSLPKTERSLLDLFTWSNKPDNSSNLSKQIGAVTLWENDSIERLIASEHFDLNRPEAFRNEINLIKMQKALKLADSIGTDIDRLFTWANPTSSFWECHNIAESIRATLRSRYDQEDWEKVVKPLNDQLRENQKQALIKYLLVQKVLINSGVKDADSLFEFFLIDVQMDPCMQTSRIKQAISSVQTFVQRSLLGLEAPDVPINALDRDRWDWMQRYRIWEANRKVFLYPENWIRPELRDDKSQFFSELESELLQNDLTTQTVVDAIKNYLFKVNEVADLKVSGLVYSLDKSAKDILPFHIKVHIFARNRNVPYQYYYRNFDIIEGNWYPWGKIQVDIPSYDVEYADANDSDKIKIKETGQYIIPVVWNKRLLIFYPQFISKTRSNKENYWEIKLCWSEYLNKRWTKKQISSDAIYDTPPAAIYDHPWGGDNPIQRVLSCYQFIPSICEFAISSMCDYSDSKIHVDVNRGKPIWDVDKPKWRNEYIGSFIFQGSQLSVESSFPLVTNSTLETDFHYDVRDTSIHSLQSSRSNIGPSLDLVTIPPYFEDKTKKIHTTTSLVDFNHKFIDKLLNTLADENLDELFSCFSGITDKTDLANAYGLNEYETSGFAPYHELKRPYSLYNWEAAFHAPMLFVDKMLAAQQFDQALAMCHYVFDPYAKGSDDERFWQFPPFKINAKKILEKLFLSLKPNQPDSNGSISEWRDRPFQPHVIARSRTSAYMKYVAMKYIEILIAYGDYYFRQNTLEAINLAIQYYVLAAHIYGVKGQKIPKRGSVLPQTYYSLLDKWDAFSNAMDELELVFPYSNQTSLPIGMGNGVVGLANVFGFASTLYFCIPDNPKLRELRDTISDRLFKIRHCEDIEGVLQTLPLFEPPIEPGLLVQAVAQGLSLSSVLNDLNSPMPNYRFYYLLQKALELCAEVKALGNAFLSAKEKRDAEALSQLRAKHESSINSLVMEVKKKQLEEANQALEALQESRKGPQYRMQHYTNLIGEDLSKIPDDKTEFTEFSNQIPKPIDESGLKLIPYEKEEMDKAGEAASIQQLVGFTEFSASFLNIIPNFNVPVPPPGFTFGGSNLGSAASAAARWYQMDVNYATHQSTNAGRKANFLRQLQDRVSQANIAGHELKNIDKQILTQQIRTKIAQHEIDTQQKQIDNAQEVEEFLRNKYTNEELYSWMEGQIRTLYHQAYTLAYDLAKRAEKVFRFERGLSTTNFIQYGYWETAYNGLLSGERLYIGLKQLEAAYQEKRGHDFEITKSISLRQVAPFALIQLKEAGTCEFSLPEVLFDMDYPGHYMRRIKSVSLRIPCVVGPYTSLNCTLRLLEHKFRTNAIENDSGYLENTDETDERFTTVNVPIKSIAVSSLEDESGVFELNFHDERYLPFEGAGAISKWRIELPDKKFKQFDYDTISDVIIRLRYMSVDGGDKLKKPASESVLEYIQSVDELSREEGLFAAFDLKNEFPNEWYKANNPAADANERVLTIDKIYERLPFFTKGRQPEKIQAKDIYLFVPDSLSLNSITATQGESNIPFKSGTAMGTMKSLAAKDIDAPMYSLKITIKGPKTTIDKMWLLERYVLT